MGADKTTFSDNDADLAPKPMQYAVVARRGDADSAAATTPVPLNYYIYLLSGDDTNDPVLNYFHENVGVGTIDGAGRVSLLGVYSFGRDFNVPRAQSIGERQWLGFSENVPGGMYGVGTIYNPKFVVTVFSKKPVTVQQANDWKLFMDGRVGRPDLYDPGTLNCILYSHLEYNNAPDKRP